MKRALAILALLALIAPLPAGAVMPGEELADPALEARARQISRELRCQVCQNQSIDDSNASLAGDLRRLVRERLALGESDSQVLDHVVARYGDYVRLTPPLRTDTVSIGRAGVVLSSPAESRSPCLSAGQRPVHFPPPVGRTLAARLMTAAPAEGWSTALAPKRIGCDREIPWKDLLQGREPACGRPRRLPIAVVARRCRFFHARPRRRSPRIPDVRRR